LGDRADFLHRGALAGAKQGVGRLTHVGLPDTPGGRDTAQRGLGRFRHVHIIQHTYSVSIYRTGWPRAAHATIAGVDAGVIEGFFGRPWAWSARLSAVDFLRDWGYRFYVYAPKADPFLRRRWREPMPEETLRHLSELSKRGAASGISIGVGLTPFEI